MSKPIIAIDVDDVLVDTAAEIVQNYNLRWKTRLTLHDYYETVHTEAWGTADEDTAIRRVNEYIQSSEYFALPPIEEAVHGLRELAKSYELHILTGRSDVIADATKKWLEDNFSGLFASVNFSNLYNMSKTRSKGDMCVEMGAAYLIDDHFSHTVSAAECGVQAVLFGDYPWNRVETLPEGVTRGKDWATVLEYFDGR